MLSIAMLKLVKRNIFVYSMLISIGVRKYYIIAIIDIFIPYTYIHYCYKWL